MNILKRILPLKIRAFLKIKFDNLMYIMKIINFSKNPTSYVLLFGTPIHNNMGDHLIALCERMMLEKIYPVKKIFEIPKQVYWVYGKYIEKNIISTTEIFISGGGWMGDLWEEDNNYLKKIIEKHPNNRIFVFPQTVFYLGEKNKLKDKRLNKEIYSECKNLTFSFREKNSLQCFREMFSDVRSLLFPDMALFYHSYVKQHVFKFSYKVGICFRNDKEAEYSDKINYVIKIFVEKNYSMTKISTMAKHGISFSKRENVINNTINLFSQFDIVITDRLHAMIFCVITNTPCIVFNNLSKKISGVYNTWLESFDGVFPVFDLIDKSSLEAFIKKQKNNSIGVANFENIDSAFYRLAEEIKKHG